MRTLLQKEKNQWNQIYSSRGPAVGSQARSGVSLKLIFPHSKPGCGVARFPE